MELNIWRLHPKGIRLVRAEKTLNGTAHAGGVKFCKPFTSANSAGWWVFPAVDIDIKWDGENYEHNLLEPYSNADHQLVKSLLRENIDIEKFCPENGGRSKFSYGSVEPNIVQMWTGCILETPPGWCLHMRSPINFPPQNYHVMEGIIESDWMQYDLWINLCIDVKNEWIKIRKDSWPPIAQLIPIRRESVEGDWEVSKDKILNRDEKDANRVFEYWLQYNQKKFGEGGNQWANEDGTVTKDSTTYWQERMRLLGREMEPRQKEFPEPRTQSKSPKIKTRYVRKKS